MKRISLFSALFYLVFSSHFALAQEPNKIDKFINASKVRSESVMITKTTFGYVDKQKDITSVYQSVKLDSSRKIVYIAPEKIEKTFVVHFAIYNPTEDPISLAFFPGTYFKEIKLYKKLENSIAPIPDKLPAVENRKGFRIIDIPVYDTLEIWAAITPARSGQVFFNPKLLVPSYVNKFEVTNRPIRTGQESGDYLFSGMMLMLAIVSLIRYSQRIRKSALLYSGYAISLFAIFMLSVTQQSQSTTFSYYCQEWLIFYTQLISFVLYSLFMMKFLKTKENHSLLHKIFVGSIGFSTIAFLLHITFNILSLPYQYVYYIEKSTIYLQIILLLVFIFYAYKRNNELLFKYIFWGNLMLVIFGIISVAMSQFGNVFFSNASFWANSLLYYKAGVLLEMFFFQLALFNINQNLIKTDIKEKQDLLNNLTLKQYEKELAVYNAARNERQQIADGLHEKLGKGLSDIRFTSELGAESNDELKRISKMSDDVLRSMNDLIWTLNTSNDEVQNLVDYFKKYAQNYFRLTPFNCIVNIPPAITSKQIEQEKRRELFNSYKDCLKKILKESKAKEISIYITCEPTLRIQIRTIEEQPIECTIS
jgi:signal transduction histidine kinase